MNTERVNATITSSTILQRSRNIRAISSRQATRLLKLLDHLSGSEMIQTDDEEEDKAGVLGELAQITTDSLSNLGDIERAVDALYALFPGVGDEREGDDDEDSVAADSDDDEDAKGSYEDLIAKRDALVARSSASKAKQARKARRAA